MATTFPITKQTGYAGTYIPDWPEAASTFPTPRVRLEKVSAIAEPIMDEEELEWDTLFARPHVQSGLDRLEEEAMRQIIAGEIEEGGFAVE